MKSSFPENVISHKDYYDKNFAQVAFFPGYSLLCSMGLLWAAAVLDYASLVWLGGESAPNRPCLLDDAKLLEPRGVPLERSSPFLLGRHSVGQEQ